MLHAFGQDDNEGDEIKVEDNNPSYDELLFGVAKLHDEMEKLLEKILP